MDEKLARLREAILELDEEGALAATRSMLEADVDPRAVLEEGLGEAMMELGRRWKRGEAYLPEVVVAADVFARCSDLVEPALLEGREEGDGAPRMVLATVQGDLHDLGKNIVGAMVKTAGFDVRDLGKDVAAAEIVEVAREASPCVVGLSALLTTTMPQQKAVVEAIDEAGLRPGVRVIVGGAPVTEEWADEIGADGYAADAASATEIARSLLS